MKGILWMEIRNERKKGLSYTEIARKHHIDPRTAKKDAQSDTKPVYTLIAPKPSKLDPYKHLMDMWMEEAPYSAVRIHEKLMEQGQRPEPRAKPCIEAILIMWHIVCCNKKSGLK